MRKSKVFRDEAKFQKLVELAKSDKYSGPKLAEHFKCDQNTLLRALYEINIRLPNKTRFQKKVHCDENFFKELTPISAYWTGFIAADGNLFPPNYVSIGLSERDETHLMKFAKAIKTDAKITHTKSNHAARIQLGFNELYNSLMDLGITPRKSLTISNVKIPEHLMSHFIRGVFDGDGSIGGSRRTNINLSIAGNKPFLEQIQDNLIKCCKINKIKIYTLTKSRAHRIQYTGAPQVFRILRYLYKDSTSATRLDRKYETAMRIKNSMGKTPIAGYEVLTL